MMSTIGSAVASIDASCDDDPSKGHENSANHAQTTYYTT